MPTKKIFKFFEFLQRLAYLARWSTMRNLRQEDVKQHSYDVAVLAHGLAVIHNTMCPSTRKLDPNKAATFALFHDAVEVFTGDVPTPVKYFGGGAIKAMLDKMEELAVEKMVGSMPEPMRPVYEEAFCIPPEYKALIKAADRLSGLRKCQEEMAQGNSEFTKAAVRLEDELRKAGLPEVDFFLEKFVPKKPMTLDDLIEGNGAWLIEDNEKGGVAS